MPAEKKTKSPGTRRGFCRPRGEWQRTSFGKRGRSGLDLRTLNSIDDISSDQSNAAAFAVPLEVLRALEGLKKG